jgi:dephospho-CoA kinase
MNLPTGHIIGLTGKPGCGKSYVASKFLDMGVPVVEYGEVIRNQYKQQNVSPKSTWEMAQALRERYGNAGPAFAVSGDVATSLINNDVVVLDGVRNTDELVFLSDMFQCNTRLVHVSCEYETRIQRFLERGEYYKTYDDEDIAIAMAEWNMKERTEREEEVGLDESIKDAELEIYNEVDCVTEQVSEILDEYLT